MKLYDVIVVGAGVFGAWTAWHLARRGQRVLLVEQYGPGNARASSGGESRIIRMGYGADELYTRWSKRSLGMWKELFDAMHQALFCKTGVLWLAGKDDARFRQTVATLIRCGVAFEQMDERELTIRYPQMSFEGVAASLLEVHSGVLLARRAVAAVVADAILQKAEFLPAQIETPSSSRRLESVVASSGERFEAGQFVFACGAWMSKVFPQILGARIFPSRQEVFFFGVPAGDVRFTPPALPTWLFQADEVYGMPDLEGRGLKIALDRHGERIDPDTEPRIVSTNSIKTMRRYLAHRFPSLRDAPIVETRVCQYENTSNGDFLIERHPEMENVWFVGGGSGHGFKHGPVLGEYVAGQLLDGAPAEPRFSLASKDTVQRRAVY